MSGRPWVAPMLTELPTPKSPAREHLVNLITIIDLERQTQLISDEGGFGPVRVEGTLAAMSGLAKAALVEVELLERRLHGKE